MVGGFVRLVNHILMFDIGCSDYNFVRSGDECIPIGPEPIPAGVCPPDHPEATYMGSSGYRLIPGNTCDKDKGIRKDDAIEKKCSQGLLLFSIFRVNDLSACNAAQPPEGEVTHQTVSCRFRSLTGVDCCICSVRVPIIHTRTCVL
jgi:hypothetical protein